MTCPHWASTATTDVQSAPSLAIAVSAVANAAVAFMNGQGHRSIVSKILQIGYA
jgi:hypothetical protein